MKFHSIPMYDIFVSINTRKKIWKEIPGDAQNVICFILENINNNTIQPVSSLCNSKAICWICYSLFLVLLFDSLFHSEHVTTHLRMENKKKSFFSFVIKNANTKWNWKAVSISFNAKPLFSACGLTIAYRRKPQQRKLINFIFNDPRSAQWKIKWNGKKKKI